MFTELLLLLFYTSFLEAQFSYGSSRNLCPYPHLEHGRPRLRQRWRMVKFSCSIGYDLVGNRYATCRDGEWDVPIPVCVRSGCEIPRVEKGIVMLAHHDAWLHAFCLPGYTLTGSSVLYCNGIRWNGTAPECIGSAAKPKLSCNFEDADLCGWTQDEFHDFDWKRLNMKTPSSFLFTGPSYDHTYGPGGKSGYYMYIESTSKEENMTARLLSPIYDADVANGGCFVFYYHMYGKDIGGLKVYQKPDSLPLAFMFNISESERKNFTLFEMWGNQNDYWYGSVTPLRNYSEAFQIVIEGIRGKGFTSDIAIDDVAILHGENCTEAIKNVSTPPPATPDSCLGRCDVFATNEGSHKSNACSCTFMCVADDDCCPDFIELCVYTNASKIEDDATTNQNTTAELPQTQKLVSSTMTASTATQTTFVPSTTTQVKTFPTLTTRYRTTTRSRSPTQTSPFKQFTTTKTTTESLPKFNNTTTTSTSTKTTRTTRATSATLVLSTTPSPPTSSRVSTTTKTTSITTTRSNLTSMIFTSPTPYTLSTTKIPVTVSKVSRPTYYKKDAISDVPTETATISSKNVKLVPKKNGWGATQIVITVISVGCLCGLIYAVVALRTSRGRLYIARIRGTATRDPEVRYLNTDIDNDDD